MMFRKDIGIDLGTVNILVYVKGEGIVLNEPSVVVIDEDTKRPIAFGRDADEMLGRTPGKIKVIKPMKDGVIADFETTGMLLDYLLRKINIKGSFFKPRILICCPSNITEVEKSAIADAAARTGAKRVFVEEEPKVAAIGAGLDISKPVANMVVDIGGGTTDIAVLSLGNIVTSASIKTAGNTFDADIINYIKDKYKLLIGEKTAEKIKKTIGNISYKDNNKEKNKENKKEKMDVRGRDLVGGLPKTITISSDEIAEALKSSVEKITKMIKQVLEQTPPELSADIIEKGIVLTGGGALLKNLPEYLEEKLEVPVFTAEDPLTCVANGTGVLLDKLHYID
ncbi:MAG: rod shape-determining protein [bacterium]|nr:rod shape-determining protein [bacterium]